MRINKYLASVGVASRRKSESIVLDGLVTVNNVVVKDLSTEILENDIVKINGNIVNIPTQKEYYIFNKPKGCVTTSSDDRGRKTVLDFFADIKERLFCVGRLDYNTTGLLIVTNDGDLANELMHPSKHISKTYLVEIRGDISENELYILKNGVILDGVKTLPALVKYQSKRGKNTVYSITIFEGKNRQVRRMFESINKLVVSLSRIKIGDLLLDNLEVGKYKKVPYSTIKKALSHSV